MNSLQELYGLLAPDVLIPKKADLSKWSVVACDQYTSEPEYWKRVEEYVGNSPSTLKLVLPEVYLHGDTTQYVEKINATMHEYLSSDVFQELKETFIYIERTLDSGNIRKGLVAAVDLERYDYRAGSDSIIRATEGTILDRIPPRVKVRLNAPLELPHIMLLIDDPAKSVIEPIANKKSELDLVYDFELMERGGKIKGWAFKNEQKFFEQALLNLSCPTCNREKYGTDAPLLLFAVGDGNHSLATAKECWERLKPNLSPEEALNHPARFALVEIVNVHDESLDFEPIHRVLFNVNTENLIKELLDFYPGSYEGKGEGHIIKYISPQNEGSVTIPKPASNLVVGTLQKFLDTYIKTHDITIDYVHGDDVVCNLGKADKNMGFILPPMSKSDLFKTVILDGVLPRKTFSMGHAWDKRYYLECRKIKNQGNILW